MKKQWSYQNEDDRRKWQNPEAILDEIGLRPEFTLIDVGCGQGFFTLPAAMLVGAKGKIYAIDNNKEALRSIKEKAAAEGLTNIICEVDEAENAVPCRDCADIVFIGQALHDFRDPALVLSNARKMLKRDGHLIDLDWKKETMQFGPPLEKRFDEDKAASLISAAGFTIDTIRNSVPYHYLIIAQLRHL
jgi:ubiquinone/menaquinone biosynthesis C-methylase UbiE